MAYDGTQVLDGVSIEAGEGEVVALLGTNGAGKSTLLRAVAGLVPAAKGAVIVDGRDTTYAPAHEVAPRGVALVPGGWATFPSLTVAENLRAAGWTRRHGDPARTWNGSRRSTTDSTPGTRGSRRRAGRAAEVAAVEEVLDTFPPLRDLLDEPAANLSGGQQHMLGLGMALLARPRLLLVDELSLGLAPAVVEQLVGSIRAMAAEGTTVVVVDQSLDVALSLAERAYFLDKGRVRFEGRTADLLDRPDLLRSTFLGNALPRPTPTRRPAPAPGQATPDGPGAPALEFVGVSRRFGGIAALDDVSLVVAPGEVVGLIGPNGAGKSTLVDLASGFLPPDAGTLRLEGRDVTRLPADARARRGLGRSFQEGRLFPGLTVETAIAVAVDRWAEVRDPLQAALFLPAAYDEGLRVESRVDELVELLGLGAYRRSFVHELSTGTRRVVELACVMALEPTVVLLDEPSSGLAQREAEALAPLLLRLRDAAGGQPAARRARHGAGHRRLRPAGGPRPGAGGGRGAAGRRARPSRRRRVVPRHDRRRPPAIWGDVMTDSDDHDDGTPGDAAPPSRRVSHTPSRDRRREREQARGSNLRRDGPLAVIVVLLAGIGAAVLAGGGGGSTGGDEAAGPAAGSGAAGAPEPTGRMPLTYAEASDAGRVDDYDWGDRCDTDLGTVRIPTVYAAPCVPVFDGDNGGATGIGVTAEHDPGRALRGRGRVGPEPAGAHRGRRDPRAAGRHAARLPRRLRVAGRDCTAARSRSSTSRPPAPATTWWRPGPTPPRSPPS